MLTVLADIWPICWTSALMADKVADIWPINSLFLSS
jgi:hypothetical protein